MDFEIETFVTHAIQERATSENISAGPDGAGFRSDDQAYTLEARTVPQAVAYSIMPMNSGKDYKARETDVAQPLMAGGPVGGNQGGDYICQPLAFDCKASGQAGFGVGDVAATLRSMGHKDSHTNGGGHSSVQYGSTVRRLMPVECERLQGFPDHFTAIPYRTRSVEADEAHLAAIEGRDVWQDGERLVTDCMADGPRYKAMGNSMPVNVIRHYLQRVERMA